MLKLIKLISYRIIHNKVFLITYLVLIPVVIVIAVYFTNSISYNIRVGVVGNVETVQNDKIQYIHLNEEPKTSKLVLNEYDAILMQRGEDIKVISTKGEEFNQGIKLVANGQMETLPTSNQQRGAATNILGFLMMIISLLGVQIYDYYFDERNGVNKRILKTSINYYQYMLSHFIVVLTFLFVPAVTVIYSAIIIFDIVLLIPLWQFILTLLLLCFFATSFGLWINSLSKSRKESMMVGNMFAIVGTIVSGGFVQVTNNKIFSQIVQVFPQKQIMTLLSSLENNLVFPSLEVGYVIIISIVLIVLAIIIEKKKLPNR